MEEYILLLVRTFALYCLVLIVFRLMGKREVGELGLSDIVVYVIIAEVASFALDDPSRPFFASIFPIIILLIIQYSNSILVLKYKKMRDLIDGDPTLIIRDGLLMEKEMKKQRYNLDDLMQQLREQSVSSIQEISYAFLEQSGKLSIYYKKGEPFILPLVIDGEIDKRHLMLIGKDSAWLKEQLEKEGYFDISEIFFCSLEKDGLYVQLKVT